MKEFQVKNCQDEILQSMVRENAFGDRNENFIKNMGFYEFSLSDLGLPSHENLLNSVLNIKDSVGLQGWRNNDTESEIYKGFSLTYNPNFIDKNVGVHHQTMGSFNLFQSFGRKLGSFENKKDTYYDSFSFRKIHPLIKNELNYLFEKFSFSLLRSRVAWVYGYDLGEQKTDKWHVDEDPNQILRINIPLQTSEENVIDIVGTDEYNNTLNIVDKHLEVGKAYIWNTRIPHRITFNKKCLSHSPRIHLVLGFCTWFDYNEHKDVFTPNQCWGMNVDEIVRKKLFLKNNI
jgi:hypothetical protein